MHEQFVIDVRCARKERSSRRRQNRKELPENCGDVSYRIDSGAPKASGGMPKRSPRESHGVRGLLLERDITLRKGRGV